MSRLPTTLLSARSKYMIARRNETRNVAEYRALPVQVSSPPTKEEGHGGSKTVPRQSCPKMSETVMHLFSLAHHAQSSTSTQVEQCSYS